MSLASCRRHNTYGSRSFPNHLNRMVSFSEHRDLAATMKGCKEKMITTGGNDIQGCTAVHNLTSLANKYPSIPVRKQTCPQDVEDMAELHTDPKKKMMEMRGHTETNTNMQRCLRWEATQRPSQRCWRWEATQGPTQRCWRWEATQRPTQRCWRWKATQRPTQRCWRWEATQKPPQTHWRWGATQKPTQTCWRWEDTLGPTHNGVYHGCSNQVLFAENPELSLY